MEYPNPAQDVAGADYEPVPELMITTLETLKVFSDPLRQKIIETLMDSAKTVKQIAGELALAPTKLYYHVNLLDEHGLIRVTETRVISGIIEKQYRASARNFAIQRTLLSPGSSGRSEGLRTALDALIAPMRDEIERGVASGVIDTSDDAPNARKLRVWRAMSRMTPDQAEAFYARLETLIEEFDSRKHERKDGSAPPSGPSYSLLIALYPTSGAEPSSDTN